MRHVLRTVPTRAPSALLLVLPLLAATSALVATRSIRAQVAISDADLEGASEGRVIALGNVSSGRVTTIPLEMYVARVVAGEAEPAAPEASQQALAIAIRTFATANGRRHARDGFDLCDGTHCQVPRNATAATRQAAFATAGHVLAFEGAVADVYYSANCGGQTETATEVWPRASYPYLRSVPDDVHEDEPSWTLERTLTQMHQALERANVTGRLTGVEIASRNDSGRVSRIRLVGLQPELMAGDAFRAALGTTSIRSTAFTLDRLGDVVRFTGRGYGHGIGMCVVGAGRRARRGESADSILTTYYPGVRITPIAMLTGSR